MVPSSIDAVGRDVVWRRVLAYVADAVAVVGCVAAAQTVRERSSRRSIATGAAIVGVLAVPYHVLLEGATGQTIGKNLLRIVVVREDGEPCTYRGAAIRTAFRVVDWLPVAYLAGLVSMAVTERRQRLGDLAAGTVVVRSDRGFDESRGD